MRKYKIIAIFAMLAVIATTAVFVGCEKKENPVVEQGIIKQQRNTLNKRHKEEEKKYYLQFCYTRDKGENGVMCTGPMPGSMNPRCSVPHDCIALPDPRDQRPVQQQLIEINDQLSMIHEQFLMTEEGGSPMTEDQLFEIYEQLSDIYDQLSTMCFYLPMSREQHIMIREDLVMPYEQLEMRREQILVLYASMRLYELTEFYDQMKMTCEQLVMVYEQLYMIDEQPIYDNIIAPEEAVRLLEEIFEAHGGFHNTKSFIYQYWDLYQYLYEVGELVETPEELYEKADD